LPIEPLVDMQAVNSAAAPTSATLFSRELRIN
jgi:hypothetical protein